MKTKQEIFNVLEEVQDTLKNVKAKLENQADKNVMSHAIELIDGIAWKYEEEVE